MATDSEPLTRDAVLRAAQRDGVQGLLFPFNIESLVEDCRRWETSFKEDIELILQLIKTALEYYAPECWHQHLEHIQGLYQYLKDNEDKLQKEWETNRTTKEELVKDFDKSVEEDRLEDALKLAPLVKVVTMSSINPPGNVIRDVQYATDSLRSAFRWVPSSAWLSVCSRPLPS